MGLLYVQVFIPSQEFNIVPYCQVSQAVQLSLTFPSSAVRVSSGRPSLNSVSTSSSMVPTSEVVDDTIVSTAAWERRCRSLMLSIDEAARHLMGGCRGACT